MKKGFQLQPDKNKLFNFVEFFNHAKTQWSQQMH